MAGKRKDEPEKKDGRDGQADKGEIRQTETVREQPVTYEAYAAMPDDGLRYELFDGKLELMSGPTTSHQTISGELEFMLKRSCSSEYVIYDAPLDVILDETNVVQPDVLMIHRSRLHIVGAKGIVGAPDLVVEIISPGSRKRDKVVKLELYARFGIPEYWVVDRVARTLEQYRLGANMGVYTLHNLYEEEDTVQSDKLPCVSFRLNDLFVEFPGPGGLQ